MNAVKEFKKTHCDPDVVAIDCGDTFSRDFKGKIIENLLNKNVDYWTPGNHDLDLHFENFNNVLNSNEIKICASNVLYKKNTRFNFYTEDVKGIKLGFFGICTGSKNSDVEILDTARVILETVKKYREKVDVLILISHLGLNEDRRIAQSVPEIDLIFGGHSHSRMEFPELINKTLIFQTGGFGEEFGYLSIGVKDGRILEYSFDLVDSFEFSVNNELRELISCFRNKKNRLLNISEDLIFRKFNDNPVAKSFGKALIDECESDAVLLNASLVNPWVLSGSLCTEDIKRVLGYFEEFYYVFLTKDEILKIQKRSSKENYTKTYYFYNDKVSDLKENEKIKVVTTEFLADGGHYGGSMFPELRTKKKCKANIDPVNIFIKYIKKNGIH